MVTELRLIESIVRRLGGHMELHPVISRILEDKIVKIPDVMNGMEELPNSLSGQDENIDMEDQISDPDRDLFAKGTTSTLTTCRNMWADHPLFYRSWSCKPDISNQLNEFSWTKMSMMGMH